MVPQTSNDGFPADELKRTLRRILTRIADEAKILRAPWEPLLDSQRLVSAIVAVEHLFPRHRLPPDKVIREGGYQEVDEGVEDMARRIAEHVSDTARRETA